MHSSAVMKINVHVRWEVWIGEWKYLMESPRNANSLNELPQLRWRFNACFDERSKAESESHWYRKQGYSNVDIRCRTTQYQARRHDTTG
jgi:hypothetical protein